MWACRLSSELSNNPKLCFAFVYIIIFTLKEEIGFVLQSALQCKKKSFFFFQLLISLVEKIVHPFVLSLPTALIIIALCLCNTWLKMVQFGIKATSSVDVKFYSHNRVFTCTVRTSPLSKNKSNVRLKMCHRSQKKSQVSFILCSIGLEAKKRKKKNSALKEKWQLMFAKKLFTIQTLSMSRM